MPKKQITSLEIGEALAKATGKPLVRVEVTLTPEQIELSRKRQGEVAEFIRRYHEAYELSKKSCLQFD